MKNLFKRCMAAALLLCMILTVIVPTGAKAAITQNYSGPYNIMLVIDGSGSLVSKAAGRTDPKNMRYALVGELLGILPEGGHNIGAIVFSGTKSKSSNPTDAEMEQGIRLNTGLMPMDEAAPDGRTVEDYLEEAIVKAGVDNTNHSCTDIGTALKVAQEQLEEKQKENGLESIVFLFTDGNTAFYGKPAGVIKKSSENRDSATLKMSQSGIRLFGAFLNSGGALDDTEMKRLVCAANGISTTSAEFQYSYVEIQDASGIHAASTNFLKFLKLIPNGWVPNPTSNNIHDTFTVPGLGVEELDIRLFSPYGYDLPELDVKITQPNGTVITGVPMKASRTYRVYKLVKPDPGVWAIDITVPEGNELEYVYTPIVSLFIDSVVESNPAPQDIYVNQTPEFTCRLAQAGTVVADPAAYLGYECELQIRNVSTGETQYYDVQANVNGDMTHSVLMDTYGTFEVTTIFRCGEIEVLSDPLLLDLTNRTPVAQYIPSQKLTSGLFQPESETLDLTNYFFDPEDGTNLNFQVNNLTCNDAGVTLNGSTLTLTNKAVGNGNITVSATDTQGASAEYTFRVSSRNVTIWYILGLLTLLIIIAIVVIASIRNKNKYRPDGELSVSFDMLHEDRACPICVSLDVPGVNTTSKTNLYKLLQSALRDENVKIQNGIYAGDVMGYLMPFTAELSSIAVSNTVKKKGKKKVGAICVKQGKKTTVLFDSFADFFLNDGSITVEFKAAEEDDVDLFNNPFSAPGKKQEQNMFDDMDDIFQQPIPKREKSKKAPAPAKKDDFTSGSDSDIDFF